MQLDARFIRFINYQNLSGRETRQDIRYSDCFTFQDLGSKNYYWDRFIGIHGITPKDTADAPTFDDAWGTIQPYIQDQTVVAHNMAFDGTCLKQALAFYDLAQPKYEPACTYKIYGKNLKTLCTIHRIPLSHHDALSDAMACAELYRRWLGVRGDV